MRLASRAMLFLACCGLLLLAGCSLFKADPMRLSPREVALQAPGEAQGFSSWMELAPALEQSLRYLRGRPASEPAVAVEASADTPWSSLSWGCVERSVSHLLELLPLLDAQPELLTREFQWLRIEPDVLLTGYYEPFLEASLEPRPDYPCPIYALPPEMVQGDPGLTRKAIEEGALAGKGLEIAWARDPVDVFFVHVQGSGRLMLPDGGQVRVRYAGSNGHDYVSLGKELIERGYATREEMSMQKIREILAAQPQRRAEIMAWNPKYIFFALDDSGPYGASGARLTPMLSCAVDRSFLPMGGVLAVAGALPDEARVPELVGLLLAQDTGTMRRNHLDLFCGSGPEAATLAGRMSGRAGAWLLLSRRCQE